MKYIKLFLASSAMEFEAQRRELGAYIRALNDIYIKRGIYFELTICEDLSNVVAKEQKKAEYNSKIRESQYFYVLFGRAAEDFSIEAFNIALESFQIAGLPQIYTYFFELPENNRAEASVNAFMQRLSQEIGHYYSVVTHLDSVKLNMLLELTRDETLHVHLQFQDGQALIAGEPVLKLENVPVYSKNKVVQRLTAEKQKLDEAYSELAVIYGKNQNRDMFDQLMELGKQRTSVAEQLHQLEMDVLNLCRQTAEKRRLGQSINWREGKAIELVDQGDYEGAKAILRDAQWEVELQHAQENVKAAKEPIREYISGKRSLILTLIATGLDKETSQEIDQLFKGIVKQAEDYEIELDILYNYASFLYNQHRYSDGIEVAERLRLFVKKDVISKESQLRLYVLLGDLYCARGQYQKAEPILRETLEMARCLAEAEPDIFLSHVAMSCNSMAYLMEKTSRQSEAELLYRETLRIYRQMAAEETYAYERNVAITCNNLAILLKDTSRPKEAVQLYEDSLNIYRRLAKDNPKDYEPYVMRGCSNQAIVLQTLARYEEAEALCREALEISRRVVKENPCAYEYDESRCCNILADILTNTSRPKEAESLYRKALEIRRRLAQADPATYEQGLAISCNNLAQLLQKMSQQTEAEQLYQEALEIFRRLMVAEPAAYMFYVANLLSNLATLYFGNGRKKEAQALFREALDIKRSLMQAEPAAYEASVALSCYNLACLLQELSKPVEAEQLYQEALEIYQRLMVTEPAAYSMYVAIVSSNLAVLYYYGGRRMEAKEKFRETLAIYEHIEQKEKAEQIQAVLKQWFPQHPKHQKKKRRK